MNFICFFGHENDSHCCDHQFDRGIFDDEQIVSLRESIVISAVEFLADATPAMLESPEDESSLEECISMPFVRGHIKP